MLGQAVQLAGGQLGHYFLELLPLLQQNVPFLECTHNLLHKHIDDDDREVVLEVLPS